MRLPDQAMDAFNDIKLQLAQLTTERNRIGKDLLVWNKRLEILNRCYDGALYWMEQMVISGTSKGTGGATTILERCRIEINEIVRAQQNKAAMRAKGSREAMEKTLSRLSKADPDPHVRLQAMRDLAKLQGWIVDKSQHEGKVVVEDKRKDLVALLERPDLAESIVALTSQITKGVPDPPPDAPEPTSDE
jgi:hypothetical protein